MPAYSKSPLRRRRGTALLHLLDGRSRAEQHGAATHVVFSCMYRYLSSAPDLHSAYDGFTKSDFGGSCVAA